MGSGDATCCDESLKSGEGAIEYGHGVHQTLGGGVRTGGCEGVGGGVYCVEGGRGVDERGTRGKREERFFPGSGTRKESISDRGAARGGTIQDRSMWEYYYRKRRPDHLAVQSNARTSGRSPKTPTTPRQLLGVGYGTQLAGIRMGTGSLLNWGIPSHIQRVRTLEAAGNV